MQVNTCDADTCLFLFFPPCYSNGVVLEDGDKYSLNEDGSELLIKHVTKVDEGDYTCIAKNKAGEKAEEVSLSVFGKKMTPFADGLLSIKNTAAGFFCIISDISLLYFVHFAAHSYAAYPYAAVKHKVQYLFMRKLCSPVALL